MLILVEKKGEVYKVQCPMIKEERLLVNCHNCSSCKDLDMRKKLINCKYGEE